MPRSRNIKPSLFKNELLGEANPNIITLFCGLWCLADRDGKLEDRPKRIKAEIFPYRDIPDFNGYLTELEQLGFIDRYKVGNQEIIKVLNFNKHQSPHKTEKGSVLPDNPNSSDKSDSCTITDELPLNNDNITVTKALIPDSFNLIPDSFNTDVDMLNNLPIDSKVKYLFIYWQYLLNHPKSKFTPSRKNKITKRLESFSIIDIRIAIYGISVSDWHIGKNPNNTKYDSIEFLCRNDENIEKFIEIAKTKKNGKSSFIEKISDRGWSEE